MVYSHVVVISVHSSIEALFLPVYVRCTEDFPYHTSRGVARRSISSIATVSIFAEIIQNNVRFCTFIYQTMKFKASFSTIDHNA